MIAKEKREKQPTKIRVYRRRSGTTECIEPCLWNMELNFGLTISTLRHGMAEWPLFGPLALFASHV